MSNWKSGAGRGAAWLRTGWFFGLWCVALAAGAAESDDNDGEPADEASLSRPSQHTAPGERGTAAQAREQVEWLDIGGQRLWMAVADAHAPVRGTMLFLAPAEGAINDDSRISNLWRTLPRYGWHGYYLSLPAGVDVAAAVREVQQRMPTLDRFVLICEAGGCLRWLQTKGAMGSIATVYFNLPVQPGYVLDASTREAWAAMQPPGLVIQEHPWQWSDQLRLGSDFELHLLPLSRNMRQDTPAARKVRGWLKRRLQVGAN